MPAFAPLYGLGSESVSLRWRTVEYRTRPDVVAGLLPPPLRPSGDPVAAIWVAEFIGASFHLPDESAERRPPYMQAGISVRCGRENEGGAYPLTFFIEGLNHGVLGREIFGLPQKQARSVTLEEDGGGMSGSVVTAGGIEVLAVRGHPFVATALIAATGSSYAPAMYLCAGAVISLVAALLTPETLHFSLRDDVAANRSAPAVAGTTS